jgi:hypothetical protein
MVAVSALQLPTSHPGGGWAAEPKLDGYLTELFDRVVAAG